ncbi:MAG: SDR family NAD(P)-dependent oxidoreductase [Bacilli bacterium]|nr:SDR family NAD(P)-dependent oxidoreductase [Bacilli bacterium]
MSLQKHKIVVITGASSGIGEATANYLSSLGHHVYGLSRTRPNKETYTYISCDVTDKSSIVQAIHEVITREGRIDVLINNAGIGTSGAVELSTKADLSRSLDVNVVGLVETTQVVLPYLRESKGMLLNLSSVAGILAIPFQTYYSMTKAAVLSFSKALALEVKPLGVRVACVLPGDTKTSFTKNRSQPAVLTNDVYRDRIDRSLKKMERDEENGVSPMNVAKVIHRVMGKKSPAIVNIVGFSYRFLVFLSRILPTRLVQWILYQMYAK